MKKTVFLIATLFFSFGLRGAGAETDATVKEKSAVQIAVETTIKNLVAASSVEKRTEQDSHKLEAASYLYKRVHGVSLSFYPLDDAAQERTRQQLIQLGLLNEDGSVPPFTKQFIQSNVRWEQRDFAYPVLKDDSRRHLQHTFF